MIVTITDISKKFDDLISEKISREEIAEFASTAMAADDHNSLFFQPKSEQYKILDAILYLSGVDLRVNPETYLHSIENFIDYRTSVGI